MRKLYLLPILLNLLIPIQQVKCQCSGNLNITLANGVGGYTFKAVDLKDTTAFTKYYWTLSLNPAPIDSNTLQTSYTFYADGNYTVCLQLSDTSTACGWDTCKSFSVTDAEYHPLLDSVNVWNLVYNPCFVVTDPAGQNITSRSNCYVQQGNIFYTSYDSTVNDLLYKKLMTVDYFEGEPYNLALAGYMREDTGARKVYFQDLCSNPEVLLYDFAMKIGDTVGINYFNSEVDYQNGTYRVDSIMQVSILAGTRRVFFLNLVGNSFKPLIWVEGVGNLGHPVYFYHDPSGCSPTWCNLRDSVTALVPYESGGFVNCFSHNRSVYFDACTYDAILANNGNGCYSIVDSCLYYSTCGGGDKDISYASSFEISPNPANNTIAARMDIAEASKTDILLWDMRGRQVMDIYRPGEVLAGWQQKEIDISSLTSGIYLVECRSKEGSLYRKLVVQY